MTDLRQIIQQILDERERQDAKWGEQNHDDYRWLAILTEEVGELAQAALHDEFGGKHAGTLRDELIQAAAVAVAWVECIDRRAKSAVKESEDADFMDPIHDDAAAEAEERLHEEWLKEYDERAEWEASQGYNEGGGEP